MTKQETILNDPKYIKIHNHGFVGLIDTMGSDEAICQAARVSYGQGTKSVTDDRNLIRYLVRHKHTSPLEMAEVKFHIKLPIFVMRQLVRHRTANLNEYSGRYSEMSDEFYIPDADYLQPQSTTNKQGRSGELTEDQKFTAQHVITASQWDAYDAYLDLLGDGACDGLDGEEYPGLARELSRIVLPVSNYTECYWKMDLHNFFHYLRLRMDSHAQREIRDFADAMYKLVSPAFPLCCGAFEDYILNAKTFSRMDLVAMRDMLDGKFVHDAAHYGMSSREFGEFRDFWKPEERHMAGGQTA